NRARVAASCLVAPSGRSAGSLGCLKLASLRGGKSTDGVSSPQKPHVTGLFKDVLQRNGGIYEYRNQRSHRSQNGPGNQSTAGAMVSCRQLQKQKRVHLEGDEFLY